MKQRWLTWASGILYAVLGILGFSSCRNVARMYGVPYQEQKDMYGVPYVEIAEDDSVQADSAAMTIEDKEEKAPAK